MPIYSITVPDKDGKPMHEKLVDAPNQASARGHVARSLFQIEVVKPAAAFALAKKGVELETAVPAADAE